MTEQRSTIKNAEAYTSADLSGAALQYIVDTTRLINAYGVLVGTEKFATIAEMIAAGAAFHVVVHIPSMGEPRVTIAIRDQQGVEQVLADIGWPAKAPDVPHAGVMH